MGSSGTGRLTDYGDGGESSGDNGGGAKGKGKGKGGGGGGSAPATSGVSQCERAHGDIALEEVARCEFFKTKNRVPPIDTQIAIRRELEGGRLAVETVKGRAVIGYLPTKYLYLRKCIQQGWTYGGQVLASSAGKAPIVRVDLAPDGKPKT